MFQIRTKAQLDNFIPCNWNKINAYLDSICKNTPVPIYNSVDIREGVNKYAPVDNNLYPAGFNNLCMLDLDESSKVFESVINQIQPNAKNIGILCESHTKNKFYLDHLALLGKTIRDIGINVFIFSFDSNLFESDQKIINLVSQSGFDLAIEKALLVNSEIILESSNQKVDFCLLNNDQSQKVDQLHSNILTPIFPPPEMGWFHRKKVNHFIKYFQLAQQFGNEFGIDPNLIRAKHKGISDIDFSSKEGLEKIATAVDELKLELPENKKIFVKANQGTYGMGISVVENGQEIINLNRKKRNKMDIGKNKKKFTSVLIQEGVDTVIKHNDAPAEVTIYLIGGQSVGGFLRVNPLRDEGSNLNAKGMIYQKFCISEIKENNDHQAKEAVYSVIGRLSTLAAGLEIAEALK